VSGKKGTDRVRELPFDSQSFYQLQKDVPGLRTGDLNRLLLRAAQKPVPENLVELLARRLKTLHAAIDAQNEREKQSAPAAAVPRS
jgi:hypothetical protein